MCGILIYILDVTEESLSFAWSLWSNADTTYILCMTFDIYYIWHLLYIKCSIYRLIYTDIKHWNMWHWIVIKLDTNEDQLQPSLSVPTGQFVMRSHHLLQLQHFSIAKSILEIAGHRHWVCKSATPFNFIIMTSYQRVRWRHYDVISDIRIVYMREYF